MPNWSRHALPIMIGLEIAIDLDYQVLVPGCDFIFNIHAAHTPRQRVVSEVLNLSQSLPHRVETDPFTQNRYLRLQAGMGPLSVSYRATVELSHHFAKPDSISELPVSQLPIPVLHYIYPSRYCQSDRLGRLANHEFGQRWHGYGRVQAIRDWVLAHTDFQSQSSNANTSALDTLLEQVGVCRDFAHLMIALCRSLNIPARFASGIDYGADPALGPTDFHAYVEVYLSGRWYIFDPSGTAIPMGFVRLGTGRDAADAAFATIFGSVTSAVPRLAIQAVTPSDGQFQLPVHTQDAVSTDGALPALGAVSGMVGAQPL